MCHVHSANNILAIDRHLVHEVTSPVRYLLLPNPSFVTDKSSASIRGIDKCRPKSPPTGLHSIYR
jgi:hypothetical protein